MMSRDHHTTVANGTRIAGVGLRKDGKSSGQMMFYGHFLIQSPDRQRLNPVKQPIKHNLRVRLD